MGSKFTDKTIVCLDCNQSFVFSADEQEFFAKKKYDNAPKRCRQCRIKRAEIKTRGTRPVETKAVCSGCGVETTLPFRPVNGKPVFCRPCFQRQS